MATTHEEVAQECPCHTYVTCLEQTPAVLRAPEKPLILLTLQEERSLSGAIAVYTCTPFGKDVPHQLKVGHCLHQRAQSALSGCRPNPTRAVSWGSRHRPWCPQWALGDCGTATAHNLQQKFMTKLAAGTTTQCTTSIDHPRKYLQVAMKYSESVQKGKMPLTSYMYMDMILQFLIQWKTHWVVTKQQSIYFTNQG